MKWNLMVCDGLAAMVRQYLDQFNVVSVRRKAFYRD